MGACQYIRCVRRVVDFGDKLVGADLAIEMLPGQRLFGVSDLARRCPDAKPFREALDQRCLDCLDIRQLVAKEFLQRDDTLRRRVEMTTLARDFSAETGPDEAKRQKATPQLRLLPTPLYRYPQSSSDQDGVVDGAVFCFVVGGGNPQILLVLEAVRQDDKLSWRYALSRRTIAELKVFHRSQEVWQVREFLVGEPPPLFHRVLAACY